jgi:putative SOS response-associated peptidase YedK
MCGRYTLADPKRVNEACFLDFSVHWPDLKPRFNVVRSQLLPTIALDGDGRPVAKTMRWGLVPFWDKSEKPKITPINARSEDVTEKPMFKQAIQQRRCLVPADGFFEWKRFGEEAKQAYFIHLVDSRPFWIAGIFETGTESKPDTYALLTTRPNSLMAEIHDRMPVILTKEGAHDWLRSGPISADELGRLAGPYAAEQMRAVAVSKLVNNTRNDGPEVLAPDRAGELPL